MEKNIRQKELARELIKQCGMIRGSVVHTKRKCGRESCKCAQGQLHPFCYLSRSIPGSGNRIVYIKPTEEKAFTQATGMYKRVWEIIEELSELNINAIKEDKK